MAAASVPLARRPSKIACVGFDDPLHAREIVEPVPSEPSIFPEAPSAVVASGDAVARPPDAGRVDDEGGIGLVAGRTGATSEPTFSIPFPTSFASHATTLEAGDPIPTGTPAGVGSPLPGDVVEVEASCGSRVTNPVVAAPAPGFGG